MSQEIPQPQPEKHFIVELKSGEKCEGILVNIDKVNFQIRLKNVKKYAAKTEGNEEKQSEEFEVLEINKEDIKVVKLLEFEKIEEKVQETNVNAIPEHKIPTMAQQTATKTKNYDKNESFFDTLNPLTHPQVREDSSNYNNKNQETFNLPNEPEKYQGQQENRGRGRGRGGFGGRGRGRYQNQQGGGYNQNYNQGYNQNFNQGRGYNQNYNQGYNQNFNQGYNQGYNQGFNQNFNQGYNKNFNQGYNQGYNQGFNQNFNQQQGDFNQGYNYYDHSRGRGRGGRGRGYNYNNRGAFQKNDNNFNNQQFQQRNSEQQQQPAPAQNQPQTTSIDQPGVEKSIYDDSK